jgi:hypothetical protein
VSSAISSVVMAACIKVSERSASGVTGSFSSTIEGRPDPRVAVRALEGCEAANRPGDER